MVLRMKQRYRLYPHPHQRAAPAQASGCARVVWNDALAKSREPYGAGEKTSYVVLAKLCIPQARRTSERACVLCTGERTPTLGKVGSVPIEWSRDPPTEPSSVTIIKDASGRYFSSFVVEVSPTPPRANGKAVGTDPGLASLVVTSDGGKIAPPRFLRSTLKHLRRRQRNLKHKRKDSNRMAPARRKIAKLHAKVGDRRLNTLHQPSKRIIRENQTVVPENLNVSGMLRNKTLARAIADAGWRQLRRLLEARAEPHGRRVVLINRWLPTSRICSTCGHRSVRKVLSVRASQCPGCGSIRDRDVNAASNILATGLAASRNGHGAVHQFTPVVAAGCEASTRPNQEGLSCPA